MGIGGELHLGRGFREVEDVREGMGEVVKEFEGLKVRIFCDQL